MIVAVATGNRHKLEEFAAMLAPRGWEARSIRDWLPEVPEPDETEPDFRGNSALKARFALARLQTETPAGLPNALVADDSGLAVERLGGDPGVYSARFAERAGRGSGDAANRAELVRRLHDSGLGAEERTRAAFVCALCWIDVATGKETAVEGRCEGDVGCREEGSGGFGYDTLFRPLREDGTPSDDSFGVLPAERKHELSHRGRALRSLLERLIG